MTVKWPNGYSGNEANAKEAAKAFCWVGTTYEAKTIHPNCQYVEKWFKLASQCQNGPIPCTKEFYDNQVYWNTPADRLCTPGYFYQPGEVPFGYHSVTPAMFFNKAQYDYMLLSRPIHNFNPYSEFAIGLNKAAHTQSLSCASDMCELTLLANCVWTGCSGGIFTFQQSHSVWSWMGPRPLEGLLDYYHFDTLGLDWPAGMTNDCGTDTIRCPLGFNGGAFPYWAIGNICPLNNVGYGPGICDSYKLFAANLQEKEGEDCGIMQHFGEIDSPSLGTRDCTDDSNSDGKHGIWSYGMCSVHTNLVPNPQISWVEALYIANGMELGEWPETDRRRRRLRGQDEHHSLLLRTLEEHSGQKFYNPANSHVPFHDHGEDGTVHFACSDMNHLIEQPDHMVPPHIKRGIIKTCNETVAALNTLSNRKSLQKMGERFMKHTYSAPGKAERTIKHVMSKLTDSDGKAIYPPYELEQEEAKQSEVASQEQQDADEVAADPSADLELSSGGDDDERDPDGNAPRYTDDAQARRMMAIVNGTSRNLYRYHKFRELQTSSDPVDTGARFSANPGYTRGNEILPSAQQLLVGDFDGTGTMDILVHSPAPSDGDCAMRCHQVRSRPATTRHEISSHTSALRRSAVSATPPLRWTTMPSPGRPTSSATAGQRYALFRFCPPTCLSHWLSSLPCSLIS